MKVAVIGAGSAGRSIFREWQSDERVQTICFDKPSVNSVPIAYRIPLLGGLLFSNPRFVETRYIKFGDRKVPFFESMIFGGSSAINGCVGTIGNQKLWSEFYAKYCDSAPPELKWPRDVPLRYSSLSKIDYNLRQYLNAVGCPEGNSIYHEIESHGPVAIMRNRFFRRSFKRIARNKNILHERVKSLRPQASGVVVVTERSEYLFDKVILCAGVLGTLSILAASFEEYRRPLVIYDHPNFRVKYRVKPGQCLLTLNDLESSRTRSAIELAKYLISETGLFTSIGASYVIYKDFDLDGIIDTKIQLLNFTESDRMSGKTGRICDVNPGVSFAITLIKDGSRGIYDPTLDLISMNYLGSAIEKLLLQRAIEFIALLVSRSGLDSLLASSLNQECDDSLVYENSVYSGYHLIGGHEIDGKWNLTRGMSLRSDDRICVVDGSSFPNFVASNLDIPIAMFASHWAKTRQSNFFEGTK